MTLSEHCTSGPLECKSCDRTSVANEFPSVCQCHKMYNFGGVNQVPCAHCLYWSQCGDANVNVSVISKALCYLEVSWRCALTP